MERHAETIALQHDVTVLYVTFDRSNSTRFEIEDQIKNRVRSTVVYCKPGLFKWLIKWKGFKRGLTHLKNTGNFDFDVIHHNVIWKDAWQALALKRWWNKPLVITEHWTGYDPARAAEQHFLLRAFARRVVSQADMICPVSDDLKQKMMAFGLKAPYTIVPNVVDVHLFTPGNKDHQPVRFLHVSHLVEPHKNISGILRVWKKVSDMNKNVHLQIGGDGDYKRWEKEALNMGIAPESITFFGEQTSSGVASLMRQSHCLILFSHYENLPVVIVEAMSAGMFVISTDVGGIREHVREERGLLVQDNDEEALLKAILHLAQNPESIASNSIRQYAVDHFSEMAVAAKFSEVYAGLI